LAALAFACTVEALPTVESMREAKLEAQAQAQAQARAFEKAEGVSDNALGDSKTFLKKDAKKEVSEKKTPVKADKEAKPAAEHKKSAAKPEAEAKKEVSEKKTPVKADKEAKPAAEHKRSAAKPEADAKKEVSEKKTPVKADKEAKPAAEHKKSAAKPEADAKKVSEKKASAAQMSRLSGLVGKQKEINNALKSKALKVSDGLAKLQNVEKKLVSTDRNLISKLKTDIAHPGKAMDSQRISKLGTELTSLGNAEEKAKSLANAAATQSAKILKATAPQSSSGPQVAELGESEVSAPQNMATELRKYSKDDSLSADAKSEVAQLKHDLDYQSRIRKQLQAEHKLAVKDGEVARSNGQTEMNILKGASTEQRQQPELGEALTSSCDSIKDSKLRENCFEQHTKDNLKVAKIDEKTEPSRQKSSERLEVKANEKISDLEFAKADNKKSDHKKSSNKPTAKPSASNNKFKKLAVSEAKELKKDSKEISKLRQHEKQTDQRVELERKKINELVSAVKKGKSLEKKEGSLAKHEKVTDQRLETERKKVNQVVDAMNQKEQVKPSQKSAHKTKPAKATEAKPAKTTEAKPAKTTEAKPAKTTNAKPAKSADAKIKEVLAQTMNKMKPVATSDKKAYDSTRALNKQSTAILG